MPKKKPEINCLYYITHVDNLPSILSEGILAHGLIEKRGIPYTPIYDAAIVSNRQKKTVPDGRSLWDFANLYFQPRNPMLYRVLHEKSGEEIVVVGVRPAALSDSSVLVASGNAASAATEILPRDEGLKRIYEMWATVNSDWWNAVDGSKRKIMAECLVADRVPPEFIHTVYVSSYSVAQKVKQMGLSPSLSIVPEPNMFFRPAKRYRITDHLFLAEGDLFFSTMQTLTVSVNVVGIMGKGLASRAKYQFPDVYVVYQDACRRKMLGMGKPYLYKREAFVDEELAEEPGTLPTVNANKWFLLFATKRHWRDTSDVAAIQQGLRWVRDNYRTKGIQSLAVPALGCGLGKLDWRDVGPIICRELATLDVPAAIYLPREREIPQEYLSARYLLSSASTVNVS